MPDSSKYVCCPPKPSREMLEVFGDAAITEDGLTDFGNTISQDYANMIANRGPEAEAQVAVPRDLLLRRVIDAHERLSYGGGFLPSGYSCRLCGGETDKNNRADPAWHKPSCPLTQSQETK